LVHDLRASDAERSARTATDRRLVVPLAYRERLRKRRAMFAHGTQLVLRRRMLLTRAADLETFVVARDAASRSRHPRGALDAADGRGSTTRARRARNGDAARAGQLRAAFDSVPTSFAARRARSSSASVNTSWLTRTNASTACSHSERSRCSSRAGRSGFSVT